MISLPPPRLGWLRHINYSNSHGGHEDKNPQGKGTYDVAKNRCVHIIINESLRRVSSLSTYSDTGYRDTDSDTDTYHKHHIRHRQCAPTHGWTVAA